MTLLVSVKTKDGIVVASDSRITRVRRMEKRELLRKTTKIEETFLSDSGNKLFLTKGGVAIAIAGNLRSEKISLFNELTRFSDENDEKDTVKVARSVLELLKGTVRYGTVGIVAGYSDKDGGKDGCICLLDVEKDDVSIKDGKDCFATYLGEAMPITLMSELARLGNGSHMGEGFQFSLFTLQDAVDFCCFAIRTTEQHLRFTYGYNTVGGNVDIVLITPSGSRWLRRSEPTLDDDLLTLDNIAVDNGEVGST